jgi:hypothetical protein
LTPSPPPPKKWQAPQVAREVRPMFCAIFDKSAGFTLRPDFGGNSISW